VAGCLAGPPPKHPALLDKHAHWKEQLMGYLFPERLEARAAAESPPVRTLNAESTSRLTALEWSVVALASADSLVTIREPGRISIAMGGLFGSRHSPKLADPRLEALRRIAVLSWHYGSVVQESEVETFVAAGFTYGQYKLLVATTATTPHRRKGSR
jgi:alkylhydroperoxidase family enzyme